LARIGGVDLPQNKRIEVALTYIFGIGPTLSRQLLTRANISQDTRVKDLSETEEKSLSALVSGIKVEGDLRRDIAQNIKRLMDIGCYRGLRHRRGLPVRGQRTKTNGRTRKGPRRTIGAGAKK